MNIGKLFKIILIGLIFIISFGGFLWNCTFSMDITKYPDRFNCGVNQYVNTVKYVIGKIFNYRMRKAENKIENLQKSLSGNISNQ